jgi:hypothetical protein
MKEITLLGIDLAKNVFQLIVGWALKDRHFQKKSIQIMRYKQNK